MKLLHADKENFIKLLGFDQDERRTILYDILESYQALQGQISMNQKVDKNMVDVESSEEDYD